MRSKGAFLSGYLLLQITLWCGLVLGFAGQNPPLSVPSWVSLAIHPGFGDDLLWLIVLPITLVSGVMTVLLLPLQRLGSGMAWAILLLQIPAALFALYLQSKGLPPGYIGLGGYIDPYILGIVVVVAMSAIVTLGMIKFRPNRSEA